MNPEQIENKQLLKRLLIVITAVILTIVFFPSIKKTFNLRSDDDWIEEAQAVLDSAAKDTVEVVQGNIKREQLEANFNADTWFSEYSVNKVAFDREHADKQIDVYGEIESIGNVSGCAEVELRVTSYAYCKIRLTSCDTGKNLWADQVAQTQVGRFIHVRGRYAPNDSNNSLLFLYDCRIYNDPFQTR